ncbi:MAG: hypothetical protein LBF91_10540 [Azoarcus sp.]|jgi:hypothetical protein|nr:hypothetical protein [Azoarcus sp.]
MSLIVSSIPGRIRIRHKALADASHSGRVRAACLALDGVARVDANIAAASLTVYYDAAAISAGTMENAIDGIAAGGPGAARGKRRRGERHREAALNRYAKYGMLSGLAAALVLANRRTRRAHALSGWLFVACLGAHLYYHRNRILS